MRQFLADVESEGALLMDATNAFNRQAALHNISIICPPLAQVLSNTYQSPVRCMIQGGREILSSEGTTQGDPLAKAMYALAVRPLIDRLQSHYPNTKQVWYTDNATGAASCSRAESMVGHPKYTRAGFWLPSECDQDSSDR